MNKQDIALLYRYNQWTTAKILNAASNVTQEQFLAPAPFPHGGLRGTLVHALFAEWIWRQRWEGISPKQRLKPDDFPNFASLRAFWTEQGRLLMEFVDGLTDERLNSEFNYSATDGTPYQRILWQTMAHLVNHGTQHKTEAAAILTGYGQSPGDIDLVYFLNETQ